MLREEAGRMRIAARPPDAVTGDAVGGRALVVAGGAAHDVLPGLRSMEERAPGSQPARRMWVERIARVGRQALLPVAVGAEADRVALLAGRLVRPGFDRVLGDVVTPVNEVPIHPLRVENVGLHRPGLRGVAVRAPVLLVAGVAGGRGRAGDRRMGAGEIPLVAEGCGGLQREVGQVDVAGVALAVVVLLLVRRVTAEAGAHWWHGLVQARLLREGEVADLALLVLLQMLGVIHQEMVRPRDESARLVCLEVAHSAVARVLLFLMAAEAHLFFRERSRLPQLGLIEDALVT